MDLMINLPERKSVGRVDSQPKKRNRHEQLAEQLSVGNFLDSLTSKRVVKGLEGENPDLFIDLSKADNSHLPEGAERHSYKPSFNYNVVYIPVNRLRQVYQTDEALDPKKVKENRRKMREGTELDPVQIGYNYDVHDGHHRWEAAKLEGYTHVPCQVVGTDPAKVKDALKEYKKVWKSLEESDLRK